MTDEKVDIVTLLLSKDKVRGDTKKESQDLLRFEQNFKEEAELTFKPQTNGRDDAS